MNFTYRNCVLYAIVSLAMLLRMAGPGTLPNRQLIVQLDNLCIICNELVVGLVLSNSSIEAVFTLLMLSLILEAYEMYNVNEYESKVKTSNDLTWCHCFSLLSLKRELLPLNFEQYIGAHDISIAVFLVSNTYFTTKP